MATVANDSVLDFDSGIGENSMEIRFIDEESADEEMEHDEEEGEEEHWSEQLNCRADVGFSEEVGINVDTSNLKSCLNLFELFFTDEVWQLLVSETNFYAQQKRGPTESSV